MSWYSIWLANNVLAMLTSLLLLLLFSTLVLAILKCIANAACISVHSIITFAKEAMVLQVLVCLSLNITQKLLADFDEIFSYIMWVMYISVCLLVTLLQKLLMDFDDIFRIVWQCYKEFSWSCSDNQYSNELPWQRSVLSDCLSSSFNSSQ